MSGAFRNCRYSLALGIILYELVASGFPLHGADDDRKETAHREHTLYARTIESAWSAWRGGEVNRARELLQQTDPELRSWEFHYLKRQFDQSNIFYELRTYGKLRPIRYVTFSPDGHLLAACADDLHVKVWDLEKHRLLFDEHDETRTVEFDSTGDRIITGLSGTVTVRDARTGKVVDRLGVPDGSVAGIPLRVQFSADDRYIAVQNTHQGISILDSISGQEKSRLKQHQIESLFRFHPSEQKLATGTSVWNNDAEKHHTQCGIDLYELSGNGSTLIRQMQLHHLHSLCSLDFSPDGRRLSVCGTLFSNTGQGECAVLETESGRLLFGLRDHTSNLSCVRFSPDGTRLATGSRDGTLQLWDAENGSHLDTIRGHTDPVSSLAFSPDSRKLASGSRDGTIRLWDLQQPHQGNRPRIQVQFDHDLALTANGGRTYTRWDCFDRNSRLFHTELIVTDSKTGQSDPPFHSTEGISIGAFAESHDARLIAQVLRPYPAHPRTGTPLPAQDGNKALTRIRILDRQNGETLSEIISEHPVPAVAFSQHDRFLYGVITPRNEQVRSFPPLPSRNFFMIAAWEAATGNVLFRLRVNTPPIVGLQIGKLESTPDDVTLALACVISPEINHWNSLVYLIDTKTGQKIGELTEPDAMNLDYQFSPDGSRLATAVLKDYQHEFRGYLSLWDVKNNAKQMTIPAFRDMIHAVAFTPDGLRVVSAGARNEYEGGEISFWELQSGERIIQIDNFTSPVMRLAFDPPDGTLIAVEKNGTISTLQIE